MLRLTKLDMARVIITALYNKPALVAADHPEAVKRARRGTVASLEREHKLALAAIESRPKRKKPPEGATCEEASPMSHAFYIPCGAPALFVVKNRDPNPYNMCYGCADHNVRNRGARYVMEGE